MKAIKFLAFLLAAVMVLLCFAACGEEDIPGGKEESGEEDIPEGKEESEENLLFKEGLLPVPAKKTERLFGAI